MHAWELAREIPTSTLEQRCVTNDHGFTQNASEAVVTDYMYVAKEKNCAGTGCFNQVGMPQDSVRQDRLRIALYDA